MFSSVALPRLADDGKAHHMKPFVVSQGSDGLHQGNRPKIAAVQIASITQRLWQGQIHGLQLETFPAQEGGVCLELLQVGPGVDDCCMQLCGK